MPSKMLQDLMELERFTEGAEACVYEADLWDKYGKIETLTAIEQGVLEHRRIKFRDGHGRCICWLSDKGRDMALAQEKVAGLFAN